ncbi:hypothetical protein AG1IA_01986 [Rhizoctonia solani AG-1 IA]|uniref:Transmembrane protein n=2 Tax=Rhizoctonia solani TaxID=456999 RepID=A0A8H7HAM1_9AGAM|nr:hypothetical protein AG1IA_01986 [Rhizoctonia solani AG-1 IA]KAF8682310.1 hypothetical protein RHS04_02695 [Rhizoctonia solani]
MESNGSGTGVFFLVAFGCIGLFLVYWLWAVHNRKRQQRILGFPPRQSLPHAHPGDRSNHNRDAVVRMEAGENTDGLPKYTPRAAIGEQTVDRNVTTTESRQANDGVRPGLMSAAPSFFRQITQFPSRPPPAYDPATSPPR